MKYACPLLLATLILLMLAVWLIPTEAEWKTTQLRVCVKVEMEGKPYSHTNLRGTEESLRGILNESCKEYFDGYVMAVSEKNSHLQAILQDQNALTVVRKNLEDIWIVWLSTLYSDTLSEDNKL